MSEENKKTSINLSRRRLAKAGLVAAPVLAVLPGKPAMALYKKNNCTVSGNLSGNMSDNAVFDDECLAYTPGEKPSYWLGLVGSSSWPILETLAFSAVFGVPLPSAILSGLPDGTIASVITLGDNSVEAHAVAAVLNSYGSNFGMTQSEVVSAYVDHSAAGIDPMEPQLLLTYKYLNGM